MKSKIIAFSVLVFLLIVFVVFKIVNPNQGNIKVDQGGQVATTTVQITSTTTTTTKPLIQKSGVHFGEIFTMSGVSVKPIELISDSRCGRGLTCVWTGTVSLKIEINDGGIKTMDILDLENPIKLKNSTLSLSKVSPYPEKDSKISLSNYLFEFSVLKDAPPVTGTKDQCFVGGCSGQICSDRKDVVSNCIWTESYACYATAKCERQQNGQCGFTETPELKMCLDKAQ